VGRRRKSREAESEQKFYELETSMLYNRRRKINSEDELFS
jgi:hypothetical protein